VIAKVKLDKVSVAARNARPGRETACTGRSILLTALYAKAAGQLVKGREARPRRMAEPAGTGLPACSPGDARAPQLGPPG
jgi:hypothetical protein